MNRKAHVTIGTTCALATVAFNKDVKDENMFQQIVGLAIGGYLGARAPDIIDPPTSPNHRSIGHGIIPTSFGLSKVWDNVAPEWETYFRKKASDYRNKYETEPDPLKKIMLWICHQFFSCLVWACKGFVIGYGSHLVCDFSTKKSLPVFC